MKQLYDENLIFLPFFFLTLLVLVLAVLAVAKFRKLYANKNKVSGLVDDIDLPGRYSDIQYSEQPTFDVY